MKSTVVPEGLEGPPHVPLWRNRDYMLLWSGQAVSLTGTVISQTAFPLLVWDLTHSAAQVGLVGGLGALPYVFLSLLPGARCCQRAIARCYRTERIDHGYDSPARPIARRRPVRCAPGASVCG